MKLPINRLKVAQIDKSTFINTIPKGYNMTTNEIDQYYIGWVRKIGSNYKIINLDGFTTYYGALEAAIKESIKLINKMKTETISIVEEYKLKPI